MSENLPVSMLELNTFAHALCTIIVYILWWRKPLDIDQPLTIQDARINPLLAYMWMSSNTSCIPRPKNGDNVFYEVGQDPEFEAIVATRTFTGAADSVNTIQEAHTAENRVSSSDGPRGDNLVPEAPAEAIIRVTPTEIHPSTGFRVNENSTRWRVRTTWTYSSGEDSGSYTHETYKPAVFSLDRNHARRWEYAKEAMDRYQLEKPNINLYLVTRLPIDEYMQDSDSKKIPKLWAYFGLSFVALLYGGLHVLAWNAQFPSHTEQLLWRLSALVIASPAAVVVLCGVLVCLSAYPFLWIKSCSGKLALMIKSMRKSLQKDGPVKEKPSLEGRICLAVIKDLIVGLLAFCATLIGILAYMLYICARGYLVYESFRTVFLLPSEAYIATSWPQYLPHIT